MTSTEPQERTEWTQAEFVAEATRRFGGDPLRWAFVCPRRGGNPRDAAADRRPIRQGQLLRAPPLGGRSRDGALLVPEALCWCRSGGDPRAEKALP
jgi:hypothetical protein